MAIQVLPNPKYTFIKFLCVFPSFCLSGLISEMAEANLTKLSYMSRGLFKEKLRLYFIPELLESRIPESTWLNWFWRNYHYLWIFISKINFDYFLSRNYFILSILVYYFTSSNNSIYGNFLTVHRQTRTEKAPGRQFNICYKIDTFFEQLHREITEVGKPRTLVAMRYFNNVIGKRVKDKVVGQFGEDKWQRTKTNNVMRTKWTPNNKWLLRTLMDAYV